MDGPTTTPTPKITPEQARILSLTVGRYLNYLGRLRRRMELRGFTPTMPLYQLVNDAYDKTHALSVELHYLGCESGVGRSGE
jgi:hypothetical protein